MRLASKFLLSLLTVIFCNCLGMQRQVIHDDNGFKVLDANQLHQVKSYDVDPMLRKMHAHQLRAFIQQGGKIRASKLNNGDYVLRAHVPGLGGGPIFGAITAFVTFTVTGVAAAGTLVGVTIVTGGNVAAGVVAGAAVGKAGCELSTAATLAATAAPTT